MKEKSTAVIKHALEDFSFVEKASFLMHYLKYQFLHQFAVRGV